MSTIAEIRLQNLENLIVEFGTQDEVAGKSGTSPVYLSQIKNKALDAKTGRPRQLGDRVARKLEAGCGKPVGWMDHPHAPPTERANHMAVVDRDGIRASVGVANDQSATTYIQKQDNPWPFELFTYSDWMTLGENERHEFEGPIAVAIMRLRKQRQA